MSHKSKRHRRLVERRWRLIEVVCTGLAGSYLGGAVGAVGTDLASYAIFGRVVRGAATEAGIVAGAAVAQSLQPRSPP